MKPKNFGFSLIELSIVLIIIGLLVAGVTGGQSLIESAKIRSLINEINNWKQARYTFYAANGRLPGDIDKTGKIGFASGYNSQKYPAGTFASPYNTTASCALNAPFIELYLAEISDFEPKGGASYNDTGDAAEKGYLPYSNVLKGAYYYFLTGEKDYGPEEHFMNGIKKGSQHITLNSANISNDTFTTKASKLLDEKIDDGIYNSGSVRGRCNSEDEKLDHGYATYEQALEKRKKGNNSNRTGRSCY